MVFVKKGTIAGVPPGLLKFMAIVTTNKSFVPKEFLPEYVINCMQWTTYGQLNEMTKERA